MILNEAALKTEIEHRLADITDPGSGTRLMELGLIRDLSIDAGTVSLTFRPSSTVCPIAFSLAPEIKSAIESVPGVETVLMQVKNFQRAEELQALLDEDE